MSSLNYCFLNFIQISQEAGKVIWCSHHFKNFPQFVVIHTVKGFGIVKKAEIDVFLELSCFFHDPADVGNLVSGSSAFSKTSLNIWKFTVHVQPGCTMKPGLEDCEHYFANLWDECNCAVVWAFLGIAFPMKYIYFCFIDCTKAFVCVDHNKLWKILKELEIPDHLTCILRSLYVGQETTFRTGYETTDWFQTGKGICQGCILSPCLFHLYAEYIMKNAGLDEAQAGINTAGRNINNLRYADNITLWQKAKN